MRFSLTSDSFNPMLVRDLRQGLRSRKFTAAFLLLQGALAFFVVLGLLAENKDAVINFVDGVLWTGIAIFYLLGLPLAASVSLTPEYRENRLDLLKLTQMQARGLVWGKWWSYCVQGAMVATSLLPYLVLTYFVGGVELTTELGTMAIMFGISSLLVALCIALSALNLAAVRILFTLGLVFFGLSAMGGVYQIVMNIGGSGVGDYPMVSIGLLLVTAGIPALFILLEVAAVRLAPAAENHDTPQRIVLLVLAFLNVLAVGIAHWRHTAFWENFVAGLFLCSLWLMIWVFIFAAASGPSPYPDIYRPFVRRGKLGIYLGRLLLYPGWPSALPFILLFDLALLACSHVVFAVTGASPSATAAFVSFCLFMVPALLFPSVASVLLARTRLSYGMRYFAMAAFSLIIMTAFICFSAVMDSPSLLVLSCVLPPDAWLLLTFNGIDDQYQSIAQLLGAAGSTIVLLFAMSRMSCYWPKFAELERRAQTSTIAPVAPPGPASPPLPSPPAVSAGS